MSVTVGIVNYNLARFLPRAIESAKDAQEIIVVDDRSTDDSMKIALGYPNVKLVLHKENSGSAVQGWNDLIRDASQEWLMLLSADDELTPDTIRIIESRGAEADWVWGDLEIIDAESRPTETWHYNAFPTSVKDCQAFMRNRLELYPTMVAAFRVSWLREHGLQGLEWKTTRAYADTITGWEWLKASPRLLYVREVFARYRKWGGSESNKADPGPFKMEFAELLRRGG